MAFNLFTIVCGDTELDTFPNEQLLINYQIQDIIDIATRNTSYSKTIKLPNTPKNNAFFQNIFDLAVDITVTSYNPKRAIPASIQIGGVEVFKGNLQLLSIVKNQQDHSYECVFVGLLKSFFYDLGDYDLTQLDLSEYNHQRNKTNVQNSWVYIVKKNGVDKNCVGSPEGYVYNFINQGNSQNIGQASYLYDQYPSVYVKTIIDKIFEFTNYTYSSRFFETEYFKKLIIPFCNDSFQLNNDEISGLTQAIGVDSTTKNEYSTALSNSLATYEINTGGNTITNFRQLAPVKQRSNTGSNWTSNSSQGFWLPLDLYNGTISGVDLGNPGNRWVNIVGGGGNTSTAYYQCGQSGFYKIEFEFSFFVKYINMLGGNFKFNSGQMEYYSRLWLKRPGQALVQLDIAPVTVPGQFQPTPGTYTSPWYDTQTVLNISQGVPSIYLNNGDRIYVEILFNYPSAVKWQSASGTFINSQILMVPMTTSTIQGLANYFKVEPVSNNISTGIVDVNMNQILPKMRMKEFFLNLVRMFNLYIMDDPNVPNQLIIEPSEMFFNSRRRLKDWTYILDRDSDLVVTPMSELDFQKYHFTYQDDNDYLNEQYKEETKEIYGEETINFVNDFSNETKDIEVTFAATPVTNEFIGNRVAPFFGDLENNVMTPIRVKPRILFYGGLKSCSYWQLRNDPVDNSPVNLLQYPYAGHYDDPYLPQYDLNWGQVKKLYYDAPNYTDNNLVQMFYEDTLNQLLDLNSKLISGLFYLTPKDMKDFDFRDVIYIDGVYYRINKIKDYDANNIDKLTEVELYKISDINFTPPPYSSINNSTLNCPSDVVLTLLVGVGYTYVSLSNATITAACCAQLGGQYINGYCRRLKQTPSVGTPTLVSSTSNVRSAIAGVNPTGSVPGVSSSGLVPKSLNSPYPYPIPASKNTNLNTLNSPGIQVQGQNNYASSRANGGLIIGSNNSITTDFTNVLIIGDNITPTKPNSLIIGNLLINEDGIGSNVPVIIDSGLNTVMFDGKTNYIDLLDGSINSVRNFGGDSKARPIIDGSEDYNPI